MYIHVHFPLTGVLETGVFARPDKCLNGTRKPWPWAAGDLCTGEAAFRSDRDPRFRSSIGNNGPSLWKIRAFRGHFEANVSNGSGI